MPAAPRPLVLLGLLASGALAAAAFGGHRVLAQGRPADDAANVRILLEAMRGTGPIPCGFALSVVEGNAGWGRWSGGAGSGRDSVTTALKAWLGEELHDPGVVPALAAALGPGDACVRQTAARLLGRVHHAAATRALVTAMRDADATSRELGAIGLGLAGDPAGYEPLVAALRDPAAPVRAASAAALGQLGDHRAAAPLLPLLARDPAPEVRRAAAAALGALE